MTDLPPGWIRLPLSELGTWYGGGTPSKSNPEFWDGGTVPWLSPKDMREGVISATKDHVTQSAVENTSVRIVPENSVAFVVRSGILERRFPVSLVPFEVTLNQDMKAICPAPWVDARWVAWGLRALEDYILRNCRKAGTTVASIETKRLMGVQLPIPPLAEQRRIVAALEDHLSHLDTADDYLDATKIRLARFSESVLADAAAGRLSQQEVATWSPDEARRKILKLRASLYPQETKRGRPNPARAANSDSITFPEHWASMSLEEVTHPVRTISYGILKPGPNLPDGIPYVRVLNMRDNKINLEDLHRTSPEIDQQYTRSRLQENDVLISIRGTYGRVALVPKELEGANITQDTARLSFLEPVNPKFAAIYLRSPQVQRHLRQVARGVAVKGVNIGDLREVPFPVPPLTEQHQIVNRVESLLQEQARMLRSVWQSSARSRSLRRSLLAEAFAGRLVKQDPADEPASVLLERIRAERAARKPVRRGRRSKNGTAPQKETLV